MWDISYENPVKTLEMSPKVGHLIRKLRWNAVGVHEESRLAWVGVGEGRRGEKSKKFLRGTAAGVYAVRLLQGGRCGGLC